MSVGAGGATHRPDRPELTAWCDRIDRLNEAVGWLMGPMIIFVTGAILYEVVSRGIFNIATIWVSEATVYGSAAVYLLTGGYAMLHRRHVRIDALFDRLSVSAKRRMDLLALPFLLAYALTLLVVGGQTAWTSFLQHEGTGTPWNPAIWPIKACIPLAGLLLLLQTFSNTLRDMGIIRPATNSAPSEGQA